MSTTSTITSLGELGAITAVIAKDPASMDWMKGAGCRLDFDLPWGDYSHADDGEKQVMAAICSRCLVRDKCREFVRTAGVEGGYWAGQWRGPHNRTKNADAPKRGDAA